MVLLVWFWISSSYQASIWLRKAPKLPEKDVSSLSSLRVQLEIRIFQILKKHWIIFKRLIWKLDDLFALKNKSNNENQKLPIIVPTIRAIPLRRLSFLSIWPLTFSLPIVPPPPGAPPDVLAPEFADLWSSWDEFELLCFDTEKIPENNKFIMKLSHLVLRYSYKLSSKPWNIQS